MTEPDVTVPAIDPAPPARIAWNVRLFLILLAATIAAVSGWLVYANTYELEEGSFGGSAPSSGGVRRTAAGAEELRFPHHAGGTYEVYLSLRNPGAVPVRISAIGHENIATYTIARMTMIVNGGAKAECCSPSDAEPFRPVEVAAGSELYLFLTLRVEDEEWPPCLTKWFSAMPVRYSVLGVDRQQDVPLRAAISFHKPGPDCPL